MLAFVVEVIPKVVFVGHVLAVSTAFVWTHIVEAGALPTVILTIGEILGAKLALEGQLFNCLLHFVVDLRLLLKFLAAVRAIALRVLV